jgi:NADH:ubiquinone oxidoreductase subunit 5 (subunit L)/multisubunit Na+/H+ antiporter MnhA subunit
MTIPLIVLAAGTVLAGYLNLPPAFGHGALSAMNHFLDPVVAPAHAVAAAHAHAEHGAHSLVLEYGLMVFSTAIVALGIWLASRLALTMYPDRTWKLTVNSALRPLYQLSLNRWWWDDIYNKVVTGGLWVVARISIWFDRWIIDGLLHGVVHSARLGSTMIRTWQNGQVQAYALAILLGVNVLIWMSRMM